MQLPLRNKVPTFFNVLPIVGNGQLILQDNDTLLSVVHSLIL